MKVDVAVLDSPSLINLVVSIDVKNVSRFGLVVRR